MRFTRRQTPALYSDYTRYKPYLRIDFRRRCCYCGMHEDNFGGPSHYAVEHFRPKAPGKFPELATVYSNLYYACDDCNRNKGAKWPNSADQAIGLRFFDPCVDISAHHFCDNGLGFLETKSRCGEYTKRSLLLDRPTLRRMRNRRREAAAKYREVLRQLRELRESSQQAPNGGRQIIEQGISNAEYILSSLRERYFNLPSVPESASKE